MSATTTLDPGASALRLLGATITHALASADVGEVAVNRAGECWTERGGAWRCDRAPEITHEALAHFATALARFADDEVSADKPILSARLPTGERVQVVQPPAVAAGCVSITIRKPWRGTLPTLESYACDGLAADTLRHAVACGQTIVIGGSTGSGKTTLVRVLAQSIPPSERVVTIEDVEELPFEHLPNRVPLRFRSESRDGRATRHETTPTALVRASMRLLPDRVVVGEVRGGEALDFLGVAASGHAGGITTVHAGSAAFALEQLLYLARQHETAGSVPLGDLARRVRSVVDLVLYVERDGSGARRIVEAWDKARIGAWANGV